MWTFNPYKWPVQAMKQANIPTHAQCSLASVKFAQACPGLLQYPTVNQFPTLHVTIVQFDAPVSREKGTFYNYGVQLKSGGIYAKHSYHKHATRGTLSLHSLYLLLWMNFSAFCVGLITQQNTEEQLRMLLSDDLPVRSYCISQVRSLWSYMRNNLLALDEELAFLIQRCSNSLLQVLTFPINSIGHLSNTLFVFCMFRNPL